MLIKRLRAELLASSRNCKITSIMLALAPTRTSRTYALPPRRLHDRPRTQFIITLGASTAANVSGSRAAPPRSALKMASAAAQALPISRSTAELPTAWAKAREGDGMCTRCIDCTWSLHAVLRAESSQNVPVELSVERRQRASARLLWRACSPHWASTSHCRRPRPARALKAD